MGITIKELVKEMTCKGYKLTEHTVKYYLSMGLLPEPAKEGGHGKGVRLVFPKDEVLTRIQVIFEWKGHGYSLEEIKNKLRGDRLEEAQINRREYLKKFCAIEERFFYCFDDEEFNPKIHDFNLLRMFVDDGWAGGKISLEEDMRVTIDLESIGIDECKSLLNEIEVRGLYKPIYMYTGKPVYLISRIRNTANVYAWISLNKEHGLGWDLLEKLFLKQKENIGILWDWPEVDGVRFTDEWVGWHKSKELNDFPRRFLAYIEKMRLGVRSARFDGDSLTVFRDSYYETIHDFTRDFLAGKCAIFPEQTTEFHFVKRF